MIPHIKISLIPVVLSHRYHRCGPTIDGAWPIENISGSLIPGGVFLDPTDKGASGIVLDANMCGIYMGSTNMDMIVTDSQRINLGPAAPTCAPGESVEMKRYGCSLERALWRERHWGRFQPDQDAKHVRDAFGDVGMVHKWVDLPLRREDG